jgi:hypothetical protein
MNICPGVAVESDKINDLETGNRFGNIWDPKTLEIKCFEERND